jgi:hypothetical protein
MTMKNKFQKKYTELRKKYTDDEIADAMLIPQNLNEEELNNATADLLRFRFNLLEKQTEQDRIYSDLLRFKYQLQNYIENEVFVIEKSFGKYLEEYVHILKRTKKQLSEDLSIHYTRLSRIFNDREEPNIELTYRLEKHSATLIPAILWWKLLVKKQESIIKQDTKTRKVEASKVKNSIKFSA